MKRFIIMIFAVYLSFCAQTGLWAIDRNELDGILMTHNQARSMLSLNPLVWDKKIAISAQKWADTLAKTSRFQHSDTKSRSGRGENLYMIQIEGGSLESDGIDATMSWLDEAGDYDYNSNTCKSGKVCGHYTQIIWKNTKKIGCGKSTRNINNTIKIYWVCQYDPPGNYIGKKPY